MIREITTYGQMQGILAGRPFFEGCFKTAFTCYHEHPSVARFYKIDNSAVLMQSGKTGLMCGEVKSTQELASFLQFSGLTQLKTDGCVPAGFCGEGLLLMHYAKGVVYLPPRGVDLDIEPNLRRLSLSSCFSAGSIQADDYYADACARKARGLANIWALYEGGEYISTAGVYSLQDDEAYISAVATSLHHRDRGYASFLVCGLAERYSDRRVVLVCEEEKREFYERLGFSRLSTIILSKAEW